MGTCLLRFFVEAELRCRSNLIPASEKPQTVTVDVAGARELQLVVTDEGDGINYDHAHWAEAGSV